jgi:hypothetical protein
MDDDNDLAAAFLLASHHKANTFSVGDMLAFRDELTEAGFEFGKDFLIMKV